MTLPNNGMSYIIYSIFSNVLFRLKANIIDTVQPVDMMSKLNDDVTFALEEYEAALKEETHAHAVWKMRQQLEDHRPDRPNRDQQLLLKDTVDYFRKRFKDRMRVRIKKKEIYDKRKLAKEKHKSDVDEVDRRENWVYMEGQNYNIRWSAMPR